jgi:predicted AlkP superfamily phosphohydrolase/phosphomutase
MVKVNEILRRKGLLTPKFRSLKSRNPLYHEAVMKKVLSDSVSRFGVGHFSLRIMRKFPLWKRIFTSPTSIDWEKTVAYVSDLSAVKSYSYGGIMINRKNLDDEKYEQTRRMLTSELSKIIEPRSGENVVKWIRAREDLYLGKYICLYPDIVFELEEDYGISWDIGGSIIAEGYMHRIQPGSHKMHSPVLLISSPQIEKPFKLDCGLMDIAPTVLDLLGIRGTFNFEGHSLVSDVSFGV